VSETDQISSFSNFLPSLKVFSYFQYCKYYSIYMSLGWFVKMKFLVASANTTLIPTQTVYDSAIVLFDKKACL